MIISHKYKFIFIKPKKIAGTSIEVGLSKFLGPKDIIPPLTQFSESHDKDKYELTPQNHKNFYDHEPPFRIKQKIGNKIWKDYFKFTAIRNPWDLVVSSYWWEINKKIKFKDYLKVINLEALMDYSQAIKKLFKPKSFEDFVNNLPKVYINTNYYFDKSGKPIEDFYIRYENLENDYKKVCKKLSIPYHKLLSLKSKTRTDKRHYSSFYNIESKNKIAKIFKKEIDYFGYKFEEKL